MLGTTSSDPAHDTRVYGGVHLSHRVCCVRRQILKADSIKHVQCIYSFSSIIPHLACDGISASPSYLTRRRAGAVPGAEGLETLAL